MKFVRNKSAWLLGALGFFSASAELVQAAQITEPATTIGQTVSSVTPGSATVLTAAEQETLTKAYTDLRAQFGSDYFNRLVFKVDNGQLKVIGVQLDSSKVFIMKPSTD